MANPRLRILEDISIGEFSRVDRAAHEGAVGVISKRNSPEASEASKRNSAEKEINSMAEKTNEDLKVLKAKVDEVSGVLKAINALTGDELAHYGKADEAGRAAFLGLTPVERAAEIEKAAAQTDVVYKSADGTEYTKADDARLVAMAQKSDAFAKEVADQKALLAERDLRKRAEAYKHLPGETETVMALLRAVDGLGAEQAEKCEAILKARDDALGLVFKDASQVAGVAASNGSTADRVVSMASEIAKSGKVSAYQAQLQAMATPEGRDAMYNAINGRAA